MRSSFGTAAKPETVGGRIKRVIYDTPIEIAIGALVVGAASGVISYNVNKAREGEIPVAFSEIEHTTAVYEGRGQSVPPLTRYYSVTNDIVMKVFESSNRALAKDREHATFARELETRIDPALRVHAQIPEYARTMSRDAHNALESMQNVVGATHALPALRQALDAAWEDYHNDHYRTEIYPVQVCSSSADGKSQSCRTEMRTRQVYDYTVHTYNYNPQAGARAAELLQRYAVEYPDLRVAERLVPADRTHAENFSAIATSMKRMLKDKKLTDEQALRFANTWATGSNFSANMPAVVSQHRAVLATAPQWQGAYRTASSTSYRTYSRSDSGPAEFQVAERALDHANRTYAAATGITGGIRFTSQNVPRLEYTIRAYVDVALGRKAGDADQLRKDVMSQSREIYRRNFSKGFDVQPFKWGEIVLFTFLGLLGGGALGFGADAAFNTKRVRDFLDRAGKPKEKKTPEKKTPGAKGDIPAAPQPAPLPQPEPRPEPAVTVKDIFGKGDKDIFGKAQTNDDKHVWKKKRVPRGPVL